MNIEIDVSSIRRDETTGTSKWHCAVGKINYSAVDPCIADGTLLYIKPSLTGDEPIDIQQYAVKSSSFPHESTADQWFDESQFESYRMLGFHIGNEVFKPIPKQLPGTSTWEIFDKLRKHWYPNSLFTSKSFSEHARTLNGIVEKLSGDEDLKFLDRQFYPEWVAVAKGLKKIEIPELVSYFLPPDDETQFRKGFYLCNELIQLMENVYLDLNLESEYDHPDNRGWMNLFRHWSWSGMFRATWSIAAGTFGARFQTFCQEKLNLTMGNVTVETVEDGDSRSDIAVDKYIFQDHFKKAKQPTEGLLVHPILFTIKPPPKLENAGAVKGRSFLLGIVAIEKTATGEGQVVYMRIRDHIRTMGFGREAVKFMMNSKNRERLGYKSISLADDARWQKEDREAYRTIKSIFDSVDGNAEGAEEK